MKKLKNASITILIDVEHTIIQVHDNDASIDILEIKLTPKQLSEALSRLAYTKCECSVADLDKVGKKMESQVFKFEVSKNILRDDIDTLDLLCRLALKERGMSDWTPDKYYGSQNSFQHDFENDKLYANAIIRKWV